MLLSTPVCIATDDRYDDSMGSYTVFYFWDGEKVTIEGGMYSDLAFNAYEVNATLEQKVQASEWYVKNTEKGVNYNKYCYNGRGANTYIGCIVKLKRSRKAPNNVNLKVTDFFEGGYCSRYNQEVTEKVEVTDGENTWVVSSNCINEVVEGVIELPFWYVSQDDIQRIKKEEKKNKLKLRLKQVENIDPVSHFLRIDVSNLSEAQIKDIAKKIYRIKDKKEEAALRLKNKLASL